MSLNSWSRVILALADDFLFEMIVRQVADFGIQTIEPLSRAVWQY